MPRKSAKTSQEQTVAPLSAETLQAIEAAVFLYYGEAVIALPSVDAIHQRKEGATRKVFNSHKNDLRIKNNYITASGTSSAGIDARPFERPLGESERPFGENAIPETRMGFHRPTTLLCKEGYLAVSDCFRDPGRRQIQAAVAAAFDRLQEQKERAAVNADANIIFIYRGVEVHGDENGLFNAQDMRLAAKASDQKAPARWLQDADTQGLIAQSNAKSRNQKVSIKNPDKDGIIWFNSTLALAYALYLDPEFYIFLFGWLLARERSEIVSASSEVKASAATVAVVVEPSQPSRETLERFAQAIREEMGAGQQAILDKIAGARLDILDSLEGVAGDILDAREGLAGSLLASREDLTEEILGAREGLTGEIGASRKSLAKDVTGVWGEVVAARRSVGADSLALYQAMLARFAQMEELLQERQALLFFQLQRQLRKEMERAPSFRSGAGDLVRDLGQRFEAVFRQFEETHFPISTARSKPPSPAQARPAALASPETPEAATRRDHRILATWWAWFGEHRKSAEEIAGLSQGLLFEGLTLRDKAEAFVHWAARMTREVLFLGGSLRLRVRSERDSRRGGRVYWLELAPAEAV